MVARVTQEKPVTVERASTDQVLPPTMAIGEVAGYFRVCERTFREFLIEIETENPDIEFCMWIRGQRRFWPEHVKRIGRVAACRSNSSAGDDSGISGAPSEASLATRLRALTTARPPSKSG